MTLKNENLISPWKDCAYAHFFSYQDQQFHHWKIKDTALCENQPRYGGKLGSSKSTFGDQSLLCWIIVMEYKKYSNQKPILLTWYKGGNPNCWNTNI